MRKTCVLYHWPLIAVVLCVAPCLAQPVASDPKPESIEALRAEVGRLREQVETQRREFESRLREMDAKFAALQAAGPAAPVAVTPAPASAAGAVPARTDLGTTASVLPSRLGAALQTMNPDVSAIVDTFYHSDDAHGGISHVLEEMSGFGHVHADGEHHHHGVEDGFNLRHLELQVSAAVDPYFKGTAIAAVDTDGAEMEVAEIETTALPWGFKVKGGKFFSDFGYINAKHSHEWDFADQPLVYQLLFGGHGLNDKGLQLSWLAPTPFYLLAGVEAFQGDNEKMFAHHGEAPFSSEDGPRVGVAWLKFGPNLPGNHGLQFGVFGGRGIHQEEHDGGDGHPDDDGTDHWLDGDTTFWGGDVVYKYDAAKPHGQGDVTLQAEYVARRKDLELVEHLYHPEWIGNDRTDNQDGYYVQAVYGFLPRWRAGLRWEQVGLTNDTDFPDGSSESYGSSYRYGPMLDYRLSEFSQLRLQLNQGKYETEDGDADVLEAYIQWSISLGAHGAHKF